MKKYFLSIIAVVLIVAASAFVKSNHHEKNAVYHWYTVDASGTVVSGSDAFGGATETTSYASAHLPCTAGSNSDCIRGFTNVPTFPTMAGGDTPALKKQ
jgi:hypothetical protein